MTLKPTCDHCDEVIGVYETMVVVAGGVARETSRLAEPAPDAESDERYHRACYIEHSRSPGA
jgi:hypothetical protein